MPAESSACFTLHALYPCERTLVMLNCFRRIATAFAVISLLFSFTLPLQARELNNRQQQMIRRAMLQELKKQGAVGVAVGYLENGQVVHAEGYGYADLANKQQLSKSTVMNWASNSKPVMAILALQLVEKGQLNLDADIHDYLPNYPPTTSRITARHLLCHQSGIPHYRNGRVVGTTRKFREQLPYLDPVNSLHKFDMSPLLFQPGAKYSYSSYAYILLSAVVQAAGKEPIDQQLDKRIIQPLRLTSFEMDLPESNNRDWSVGYYRNSKGQVLPAPEEAHYWKHGAGGYKSNIRDFARWAQAMMNDELISARTRKLMWTAQPTNNGQATKKGLGVTVEVQNKRPKISHNGSQTEARSRMVLYPSSRNGVVILSNSNHANPGRFSTAVYKTLRAAR